MEPKKADSPWKRWEKERARKGVRERAKRPQALTMAQALGDLVNQPKYKSRLEQASLFNEWPKVVGAALAKKATPVKLERGKLHLHVENSAWRHQLFYMQRELIGKINAFLGERRVREIIFTTRS